LQTNWWAQGEDDPRKRKQIVNHLQEIAERVDGTSLKFEDGFSEIYKDWCKRMYRKYAINPEFETLEGATARSPFNNLKLAAIIELSKDPNATVISIESGIIANNFMDYILETLVSLIGGEFIGDRDKKRKLVRDFFLKLREKRDISVMRSSFQSKFSKQGIDAFQLDQLLIDLVAEGVIKIGKQNRYGGRTVTSTVIVIKEKRGNKN
jgi:hypothetical protein